MAQQQPCFELSRLKYFTDLKWFEDLINLLLATFASLDWPKLKTKGFICTLQVLKYVVGSQELKSFFLTIENSATHSVKENMSSFTFS